MTATVSRIYVDTTTTSTGDVDHIAVERVVNADPGPRPQLTEEERRCAARLLQQHGFDAAATAKRLRLQPAAVRALLGLAPPSATPRQPPLCGSRRAYRRHLRNNESACDDCRAANTAADRRLRNTGSTLAPSPAAGVC